MVETQQQMAIDPAELRGLLDRQAITEQINRYAERTGTDVSQLDWYVGLARAAISTATVRDG